MLPIKIGYKTYKLDYVSNPMGTDMGQCHNSDGMIYIDKEYSAEETFNTVIHEILHAIYYVYGIKATHEDEERIVNTLSNGIAEVVLRNPKLLKELQRLAKEI